MTDCSGERLAIFTPTIGRLSETFVRRHIEGLGNLAAVIYGKVDSPVQEHGWRLPEAVFELEAWRRRAWIRIRIARKFGLDPEAIAIRRFLRRAGVSVLLGEFLGSSLPIQRAVRGTGIRFLVHLHGHDASARLRNPAYRTAYLEYAKADCEAVVSNNKYFKRHLEELGIPGEKIKVVPYGIEIPEPVGFETGIGGEEGIRCLAVGRMVSKKAPILLLEAFRRAVAECPNLRLRYVGGGELRSAAQQFVEAFGLEESVQLPGGLPYPEVISEFRKADIFIQHSRVDPETGDAEGLPLAILEAMAYGLPVVATRHSGIPEAVVEGETGLLSDEGDVGAMATNLVRLARNRDLLVSMGQQGRRRAETRYSWEVEKRGLEELLLGKIA